jgi:hypothetical protein
MKFTVRAGLWLTLAFIVGVVWFYPYVCSMLWWHFPPRAEDPGPPGMRSGNLYLPGDLYAHWAREIENSDRWEQNQAGTATFQEVPQQPSPFARIDALIPFAKTAGQQR